MKGRQAAIIFVLVTVTLDMLTVGLISPVLPKLILDFLGGNMTTAAHWNGWFGLVFALMQFFFSPLLGVLSDRFGRRPVILLSNLGLGLDYIVMAMAPTLGWLFLGRIISGITTSSVPTAMAYISDVTPKEKRAGAFGMIGVAFSVGFILGPAIGGMLGDLHPRLPFWIAAGFSLANWLWGYFVVPESLSAEHRKEFTLRRANPVGSLVLLRSHHELWRLATIQFFAYLAHNVFSIWTLYAIYRYAWTPRQCRAFTRRRRDLYGHCFGRTDRANGETVRRTPHSLHRSILRCGRDVFRGPGANGRDVSRIDPDYFDVEYFHAGCARHDDAPCE